MTRPQPRPLLTLSTSLEVVVSNATTFGLWNLYDGVIKGELASTFHERYLMDGIEGFDSQDRDSIDKGIFIRALTEARMRNPGTALAKYIEAYITIQAS